jgi:hypothetical protein
MLKKFAPALAISLLWTSSVFAAGPPVLFEAMDGGIIIGPSPSSPTFTLNGTGIATPGGAVNDSATLSLVPSKKCTGGFSVHLIGVYTVNDATDALNSEIHYIVDQDLCPTAQKGILIGNGVFTITGGTGKFLNASGGGKFDGLGDFLTNKYTCTLQGLVFLN